MCCPSGRPGRGRFWQAHLASCPFVNRFFQDRETALGWLAEGAQRVDLFHLCSVRVRAFGASSLDFDLPCWVENPELRGRVLDALNTAVYKRFQEQGIEIPYAKQDLYIKEMPSAPGEAG